MNVVRNPLEEAPSSLCDDTTADVIVPLDPPRIVGIGASAGGLEAFTKLLSRLPPDTGMIFVLVQHMDPTHPCQLPEILSRSTTMSVELATDGMKLAPNHIYIAPAHKSIAVSHGCLIVGFDASGAVPKLPIDTFMIALAADLHHNAIGVVLSGTGADGAKGLASIKEEGGMTFAQDPASALYKGMPEAAAAQGVDFILTPQEIGAELGRAAHRATVQNPVSASAEPSSEQKCASPNDNEASLLDFIRSAKGVDFRHYKAATIKRRIGRRMALLGLREPDAYLHYLKEQPAELNALYEDILIKVTSFFRDPELFDVLKQTVIPTLLQHKSSGTPLRIWVPGCASGEEAYTIAMCLAEFYAKDARRGLVQIFATDISKIAIAKARTGCYGAETVECLSPERLKRFFVKNGAGYQIDKSIRDMCVFAEQNVAKDPPFSKIDLISCRNLLIYLDPFLQRRVMATFHFALDPSGFLMLGSAETIGPAAELFTAIDNNTRIFMRRAVPSHTPDFAAEYVAEKFVREMPAPPMGELAPDTILKNDADRALVANGTFNGVVIDPYMTILQFRGQTAPFLEHRPEEMASCNLFKMARKELAVELRLAIHEASVTGSPVRAGGLKVTADDGNPLQVSLEVIPYRSSLNGQRHFVVLFAQNQLPMGLETMVCGAALSQEDGETLSLLRHELLETKDYLNSLIEKEQAANEELKSASEEILSSNEELRSTNEELQTAKEEAHAINEELTTVNEELRARNAEVSQAHSDLSNIFTSTQTPMLILAADLTCRMATPATGKALGLSGPPQGCPVGLLLQRFHVADLEQLILGVIETLIPAEREVQDQDGLWYAMRIRPYRTIENRIEGAVISLFDISLLKETILHLEETKKYSQAIVETVPVPLLVLDEELRVVLSNQSFDEAFQLEAEHIRGELIYRIGHGEWDIPELSKLLEGILPHEEKLRDFVVKREFPHLGYRVMKLNARRLLQQIGKRALILLTFDDATVAHRAEQEVKAAIQVAQNANRAKSDFLANMSHEIRTPLAAILGFTELLESREQEATPPTHPLAKIRRNVANLTELIDDILDLSRVEAGKLEVNRLKFNLLAELSDAFSLMSARAQAKAVAFHLAFAGPVPETIVSCPLRLRQILLNVLGNAVKFTERGSIHVTVEMQENARLAFIVNDTGCGMTSLQQGQIFQQFGQADSSVTRKYGGTGLGLNLSRRLAEALGGSVVLTDSQAGRGSTFTILIDAGPLEGVTLVENVNPADLLAKSVPSSAPFKASDRLMGMHILLVEDSQDNQILLREFLAMGGAQVTLADDGAEGLRIAQSGAFDLVFMDIQMPVMDGYEASRRLKAAGYDSPLIALTAHTMSGEREKCLAAGYTDYVAKPVSARALTDMAAKYGLKKKVTPIEPDTTGSPPSDGASEKPADASPEIQALLSTLAGDPCFDTIIDKFVKNMPIRVAAMRTALLKSNFAQIRDLAHQMSGAAGGYGYPDITLVCRDIETRSKSAVPAAKEMAQLVTSCAALVERAAQGRAAIH